MMSIGVLNLPRLPRSGAARTSRRTRGSCPTAGRRAPIRRTTVPRSCAYMLSKFQTPQCVMSVLNCVVLTAKPVHHVAAERRARRGHAVLVDVRQFLEVIDALHQIVVALAAPVAADFIDVLLAEAGAAARIGQGDDVALRRPQFAGSSDSSSRPPTRLAGRRGRDRRAAISSSGRSRAASGSTSASSAALDLDLHALGARQVEFGEQACRWPG